MLQTDLAPSLAVLLGVPIPFCSLGTMHPALLGLHGGFASPAAELAALRCNAEQVRGPLRNPSPVIQHLWDACCCAGVKLPGHICTVGTPATSTASPRQAGRQPCQRHSAGENLIQRGSCSRFQVRSTTHIGGLSSQRHNSPLEAALQLLYGLT